MVFLLQKVHQIWHKLLLRAIRCTVQVTDTSFSVLFCQSAYQVHSFLGGIRTAQDKGRGKLGVINTPWKRNCHLHSEPSVWCWLWPVVNWCIDLPGNYVRLLLIVIFIQLFVQGIEKNKSLVQCQLHKYWVYPTLKLPCRSVWKICFVSLWCPKRTCMLEDSNKIKLLDNSALKLSKNHGLLVITFMGLI